MAGDAHEIGVIKFMATGWLRSARAGKEKEGQPRDYWAEVAIQGDVLQLRLSFEQYSTLPALGEVVRVVGRVNSSTRVWQEKASKNVFYDVEEIGPLAARAPRAAAA